VSLSLCRGPSVNGSLQGDGNLNWTETVHSWQDRILGAIFLKCNN
jgi:hypothetical protein